LAVPAAQQADFWLDKRRARRLMTLKLNPVH
jgi:hypothetical protein